MQPFAGKPAPTRLAPTLWERACPRRAAKQPPLLPSLAPPPNATKLVATVAPLAAAGADVVHSLTPRSDSSLASPRFGMMPCVPVPAIKA